MKLLPTLACILLFCCPAIAQIYWPNDLEYFKTELPKRHKNLFFKMPKNEFEARVDALIKESMALPPATIGVRLQQLMVDLGDSHSGVSFHTFFNNKEILPICPHWFDDGWSVLIIDKDQEYAIGDKILKINGHEIQEIVDSLSTILVQDNNATNKAYMPDYMFRVGLMEYFGFVDPQQPITYTLENKNGTYPVIFDPPFNKERGFAILTENRGIGYQNEGAFFWDKYIEEDSVYFVQYNRCNSKEMERKYGNKEKAKDLPSFKKFEKKILKTIKDKPIKKFVFDMRHNGGGSSIQGTQLVNELKKIDKINQEGKLFVIVGRKTFSSAIINAMDFKQKTKAIIIGEETAGSPNHFGEVRSFKLPTSGLRVRYSTKYFKHVKGAGKSIIPDIVVPITSEDYLLGRDPFYETIKSFH
jgi:hypothetical protein